MVRLILPPQQGSHPFSDYGGANPIPPGVAAKRITVSITARNRGSERWMPEIFLSPMKPSCSS